MGRGTMEEAKRCLQELIIFSRLEENEVRLICERSFEKRYQKGEIIFFEDNDDRNLYILVEGRVKLTILSPEGKEKVLTILQVGDIFGDMSLFDQDTHLITAEVIDDARLLILHFTDLETVIRQEPGVAVKIIEALAKKTRLLTGQIKELVFQDAEGRLASLFIRFIEDFGIEVKSGNMIDIVLTHQDIASLIGSSRVTVTKLMNQFIDQGLIKIYKRKIIIRDMDRLKNKIEEYI